MILQFQIAAFRCFITKSTLTQWISFILNPVALIKYEQGGFKFDIKQFDCEAGFNKSVHDKWAKDVDWTEHCDISIKVDEAEQCLIKSIKSLRKITKKWTEVKKIDWSNKYLWDEWQIPPEERYLYDKEDIFEVQNQNEINFGQ